MNFRLLIIFLISFLNCIIINAQYRIEGEVYDQSSGTPIPGAHLVLGKDLQTTVSDENGFFVISFKDFSDTVEILASFVGKESIIYKVGLQKSQSLYHIHLYLNELGCEKCKHTDYVLVEESALSRQNSQSTQVYNSSFFEENLQGNFSKSLERIAGINSINIGTGIAKPVIRGLAGNRILLTQNGIAQQGQQWGNDHGLEIDALSVDRMEIIKGAASMMYGSDGLGGIINILPERVAPHNTLRATVQGIYKSNNAHWGTSAHISSNYHNFFVQARYSRQESGDYRIPADSFIYNGFVLPIFDAQLKNTAVREENFSLALGSIQKWGVLRFTATHFGFKSGIFSGAMGIPRAYELNPDGNNRDIDLPSQSVSHLKGILNADFVLPNSGELKIDLGYQRNLRREFSFADAHLRNDSSFNNSNLAMQLLLQTLSANMRIIQPLKENLKLKTGLNFQQQSNERAGFDYLLPNFSTIRSGIYTFIEYQPVSRLRLDAGIRFDYANNLNQSYSLPIRVNGQLITELSSPQLEQHFYNWAAALGLWYMALPEKISIRAHLGRTFRVPYPVETLANGVHHGTFRHEQGSSDLRSESGIQFDFGTDLSFNNFDLQFSAFGSYYNDYIYLSPTARFSPLPDAGQLFKYQQTDALYCGGELSWSYKIIRSLSLKQSYDYVWNINLESMLGLPFTPAATIRSQIRIELPNNYKSFEKAYFEISHRYSFAQNRVDRNEKTTPAYQLFDLGLGSTIKIKKQQIVIGFQVQNLFNTAYLQHLSRYRLLNLPEQGRNLVFMLKIPFELSLEKKSN
jgi:iron complex outermembrane receptor protein